MEQSIGWARIWAAGKREHTDTLRQGAWYPVVGGGATQLVLDVSGRRIAVPPDAVEVRPRRPDRFTVVYRTHDDPNPARGTRADVGRVFAVCPMCAYRVRLPKRPQLGTSGTWAADSTENATCPNCRHKGVVAWWETG